MIGEVVKTAIDVAKEVGKKAAEISAETAKETAKDTGKSIIEKPVDITKRIDIVRTGSGINRAGIDITKRILPEVVKEVAGVDLTEVVKDYLNDLKAKSIFPETLAKAKMDISKLEIQSPERVAELQEDFDNKRDKLRKEWERMNNKEWPKYTEDVFSKNNILIRKKGEYFDAHHIQPLKLGGANDASNLTPLDVRKHIEVHSLNGSCRNLLDAFKG